MDKHEVEYNLYSDFLFDNKPRIIQICIENGVTREFNSARDAYSYYTSDVSDVLYKETLFMSTSDDSVITRHCYTFLWQHHAFVDRLIYLFSNFHGGLRAVEVPRKVILPLLKKPEY